MSDVDQDAPGVETSWRLCTHCVVSVLVLVPGATCPHWSGPDAEVKDFCSSQISVMSVLGNQNPIG